MDDHFLKRDTEKQRVAAGQLYRVVFDDCCVAGSFVAVLGREDVWNQEGSRGTSVLTFENGVRLSNLDGVQLTKVSGEAQTPVSGDALP